MSYSECCQKGSLWDGTPQGEEKTLGPNKAYMTGTNPDAAVMLIHDAFGWKFPNTRLLADSYAKEADVTVYLPDFFGGESLGPFETIADPTQWHKLDLAGFMSRNTKDIRTPEIFECARALRTQHEYKRVGAIGFCFGGWAVFRLGAKSHNDNDNDNGEPLVDCISTGHPSLLEKTEIDAVGVPVQILAPEHDVMFLPELKEYANKVIPTLGVAYDYQYFPGVEHGFCTRGDVKIANGQEYKAMNRAREAAISWFKVWLHPN
ncbi:hypothetical protein PV08_03250 [Exophiala spinifera]|uniref:Dienelactone hydrolase domain-containing protein n=1 Tax=Exophiala spinifera TaxID=91928 RepID=A0A0D1YUN7_9EURO|nr:uncharacterized protein PV08_03250 [Exophiala spinifera]KIW18961.1 hypothetical protein PV08_03250 [Exophiala spinifera]